MTYMARIRVVTKWHGEVSVVVEVVCFVRHQ